MIATGDGSMTFTTLGKCCEVISGATPRRDHPEYWDGDIPWVTPKELGGLEGTVLRQTEESITEAGFKNCSTRMLPAGSVLFSSRAPIGLVAIAGISLCTNQGFKSFIPGPDVDSGYLYWWLKHHAAAIAQRGNGTTFAEISKEGIERVPIVLPPLAEQRRVAAVLDRVDRVRGMASVTPDHVEAYLRALFLELFGEPVENPRGWHRVPMGAALTAIEAGWSANGEERDRREGEFAVLKISAVTSGRFNSSQVKVVAPPPVQRALVTVRRGDLLFSRANTRELVAATCLVEEDQPFLFLPDKLWRLIPKSGMVNSEYLRYLLSNKRFRDHIRSRATGSSGSMLNVSQAKVAALPFPVPPLALQERFARAVWRAYGLESAYRRRWEEVETLRRQVATTAFSGRP